MPTILIVDDHPENRYFLETILHGQGYATRSAENGAEALKLARTEPFDLIVSDILMPVMDGFALCRICKQDADLAGIPFAFYTATYTEPKDEQFALSLGAERFLLKPLPPEELLSEIQSLLGRRPRTPELPVAEADFIHEHHAVLFRKLEKKMADNERLAASNTRLGRIISASLNEILVFDGQTLRFSFVNQGALEHLGYSETELRTLTPLDLCPDLGASALEELLGPLREGAREKLAFETSFRRKDGSSYPVAVHLEPILDGRELSFLSVAQDISERKRLEQEARQAQKLEAIGRLAGGVAHDFNNMLNVILINSELALMTQDLPDKHRLRLLEIKEAAERSATLTRQLLTFSRKQAAQPKRIDLNDVVLENQRMLERMIEKDIDLAFHPAANLHPVWIDPGQVSQILANLVINARDALAGAGTIVIETANVQVDEESSSIHGHLPPGAYVKLTVSDTGSGIDPAHLEQLFEPFFTTKGEGKGTGLGLATVHGIVRQAKGAITVTSHLGLGTSFKLFLPISRETRLDEAPLVEAIAPGGRETILLAEDEQAMLSAMAAALTGKGYTVLTAASPMEALLLAQRHPEPIHLLVTDVVMPGMNGKALHERIAQARPQLKALFISGYPDDIIARRGLVPANFPFIQKPFRLQSLARKVREALDS